MKNKKFSELVDRAKNEPEFLYKLTYSPEELLSQIKEDFGREVAGGMIAKDPAEMVARTIGISQACGNTCTSSCENTCGQSCGFTTNLFDPALRAQTLYYSRATSELQGCGNTCTTSCGNTCGQSCGFTTNLQFDGGGQLGQVFR